MQETIDKLNALRKKQGRSQVTMIAGFIVAGIAGCTITPETAAVSGTILVISFIIAIIGACMESSSKTEFKELYKNTFVKDTLSNYFEDVVYTDLDGFTNSQIYNFELVKHAAFDAVSEDYLQGVYEGVKFEQADVKIQSGGKNKVTYFHGRMLSFEIPNQDVKSVQLASYDARYVVKTDGKKYTDSKPERERLNKLFKIRTEDEQDVDKILTPSTTERLCMLVEHYPDLIIHFKGNKLHIAINDCPDCFDPPADVEEFTVEREQQRVRNDIHVIINIINTLLGPSSIF